LIDAVGEQSYLVGGVAFTTAKEYAPLDLQGLADAARDLRARNIKSIA